MLPNNTQQYLVRTFSSDRPMLYATVITIDTERPQPSENTAFTFAERPAPKLTPKMSCQSQGANILRVRSMAATGNLR